MAAKTVGELIKALSAIPEDYEVLNVVDGCFDNVNTIEIFHSDKQVYFCEKPYGMVSNEKNPKFERVYI